MPRRDSTSAGAFGLRKRLEPEVGGHSRPFLFLPSTQLIRRTPRVSLCACMGGPEQNTVKSLRVLKEIPGNGAPLRPGPRGEGQVPHPTIRGKGGLSRSKPVDKCEKPAPMRAGFLLDSVPSQEPKSLSVVMRGSSNSSYVGSPTRARSSAKTGRFSGSAFTSPMRRIYSGVLMRNFVS